MAGGKYYFLSKAFTNPYDLSQELDLGADPTFIIRKRTGFGEDGFVKIKPHIAGLLAAAGVFSLIPAASAFAAVGWVQNGSQYEYYNEDGTRATGWKKLNDKWYYFYPNGIMAIGSVPVDGKYYYFLSDGTMVKGWLKIGNNYYYMRSDGSLMLGWRYMEDGWYYYEPTSGICAVNTIKSVDGERYLFGSDGKMDVGWQQFNGAYYYFSSDYSDGKMLTGWLSDGTNKYYMDPETGIMSIGWKQINQEYYYFNSAGHQQTGWVQVDQNYYYLDPDTGGKMAAGTSKTINGITYQFDSNGICQTGGGSNVVKRDSAPVSSGSYELKPGLTGGPGSLT